MDEKEEERTMEEGNQENLEKQAGDEIQVKKKKEIRLIFVFYRFYS